MNCADHGSIVLLNEVAPDIFVSTFGKHELTYNIIDAIHLPIETAVELDFYKNSIRNEMKEITNSALHEFFKILTQSICGQTILNNYLHDFHKQESTYLQDIKEDIKENMLTKLANKYQSDKGSTYKCAHGYTDHYNRLFKPFKDAGKEFKLLEIGLNRDNQNSIPSLDMYREYFGDIVTLYGFDIHPDFKKFHSSDNKTFIIIGDQSSKNDLKQCTDTQYEIIIDDGYHASKHQQISLLTLWDSVSPGGIYVIEDLHYQPETKSDIITKDLIRQWKDGKIIGSTHITSSQVKKIMSTVDKIEMFDSKSKNWSDAAVKDAIAIFYKKEPK
jgi:hypothetical protein